MQRIKLARENGFKFRDTITVADLWTIIAPKMITPVEYKQIKEEVPAIIPGWLTDTVSSVALFHNIYH